MDGIGGKNAAQTEGKVAEDPVQTMKEVQPEGEGKPSNTDLNGNM